MAIAFERLQLNVHTSDSPSTSTVAEAAIAFERLQHKSHNHEIPKILWWQRGNRKRANYNLGFVGITLAVLDWVAEEGSAKERLQSPGEGTSATAR